MQEFFGNGESTDVENVMKSLRSSQLRNSLSAASFGNNIRHSRSMRDLTLSGNGIIEKQENAMLQSQLQTLYTEISEKEKLILELTEQLTKGNLENQDLKLKIDGMTKKSEDFLQEVAERDSLFENYVKEMNSKFEEHMANEKKKFREKLNVSKERIQTLTEENEHLNEEVTTLRKKLSTIEKKFEVLQLEQSNSDNAEHENRIKLENTIHKLNSEIQQLTMKFEELEKEKYDEKQEMTNLQNQLMEQKTLINEMRHDFMLETDALNDEKMKLVLKLADLQSEKPSFINFGQKLKGENLSSEILNAESTNLLPLLEAERETVRQLRNYIGRLLERVLVTDPNCLEMINSSSA